MSRAMGEALQLIHQAWENPRGCYLRPWASAAERWMVEASAPEEPIALLTRESGALVARAIETPIPDCDLSEAALEKWAEDQIAAWSAKESTNG